MGEGRHGMAGPGTGACAAPRTLGPAGWGVVLEGRIVSVRKMRGDQGRTGPSKCHSEAEKGGSGHVDDADGGYCLWMPGLESPQPGDQYQTVGSGPLLQLLFED